MTIPFVSIANAATNNVVAFGAAIKPVIDYFIYPLVQLAFAVAIIVFVYGVIQMIINAADETAREKGKSSMLWGVVGMIIMVCAWGIIYLISNTVLQFK